MIKFKVEATILKRRVDDHLAAIRQDSNRLDGLPTVNGTGKLKILPPISNDCDIVKLYETNEAGDCVIRIDQSKNAISAGGDEKVLQDPTTYPSLRLLEQKIQLGEEVFAQLRERQPWVRCKVKYLCHKPIEGSTRGTTAFKLKVLENDGKTFEASKYCVARIQNHGDKLRVPKRVIAGANENELKPGIIGQEPCSSNKSRYMILFDDGSAGYFQTSQTYPICYQSTLPWQDSHFIGPRNKLHEADLAHFIKQYPKRFLIQISAGQKLEIKRHEVVVPAMVVDVDCDLMTIAYKDRSRESLYRGSVRIPQRATVISQLLSNQISLENLFFKIPGNVKRYHEAGVMAIGENYMRFIENFDSKLSICGKTARKSTSAKMREPARVKVKYAEDTIVDDRKTKPRLQDLLAESNSLTHKCVPCCLDIHGTRTEFHVEDIISEFRNVSDLKVPLILGWKRMLVRAKSKYCYAYQAPCGKVFHQIHNIRRYIATTGSKLDIDYFTFDRDVDLNRAPIDMTAYLFEENIAKDLKTGKPLERKYVSLMNQFDEEQLPMDYEYRSETFPHPMLIQKGFSFNREFKSGCDCEFECSNRSSCACHQLIEEAFGTNAHNKGIIDKKCQYKDKRLMQQVSTGIFECNEFCSCTSVCPNRVVQNGIRFRLQVRKTRQKGWGVVTLDDIPAGAFISTYSAELLDDADQYGNCDTYYADLDYISVVEEQKLFMEDDDTRSDEGLGNDNDEDGDGSRMDGDDDNDHSRDGQARKRCLSDLDSSDNSSSSEDLPSLDYETLEFMPREDRPRRITNGRAMGRPRGGAFRRIHSILNDSQDYTLDARMQGNIGRFFNHSCDPNSFVQNVFIETHDLRFPVVSFFAKRCIAANEEITWNYNYKMGSIEGREIRCNCGAPNCLGRIL